MLSQPLAGETDDHIIVKTHKWTLRLLQKAHNTAYQIFESIRRDLYDGHYFDPYMPSLPKIFDANVMYWTDKRGYSIEALTKNRTSSDFNKLVDVVWDELRFVSILA
jgi:hypothetical protein